MLTQKTYKSELVAPGGSFAAAVAALESGADAVYVGLKRFSARAFAANLELSELRKLKGIALKSGKKVYVALNVVIKQDEVKALGDLLSDLALLDIDGIIIQDLGLLYLAKTYFPSLPLHASTQLAVYNKGGVAFLRDLGIKRVILPRELRFAEIKTLRRQIKDIELEVFVHGALCYSFSGLCLAGGLLLKRSGNRGECAQVCRTWFNYRQEKGYYFSCNDLMLKGKIRELADIGINAFKIEGRMKSPLYTALVSGAYAEVLKGGEEAKADSLLKQSRLVFSREPTKAYYDQPNGERIINKFYPSHTGLALGKVINTRAGSFLIRLERDLALRDGLMFFLDEEIGPRGRETRQIKEPCKFGVKKIIKKQRRVFRARKGEEVWIEHDCLPQIGQIVYKISEQDLKIKEADAQAYPAYKVPLEAEFKVFEDKIEVRGTLPRLPAFSFSQSLSVFKGRKRVDFAKLLKEHLAESGDSYFSLAGLTVHNHTQFGDDALFIQPSVLKRFKHALYEHCQEYYTRYKQDVYKKICEDLTFVLKEYGHKNKVQAPIPLPPRSRIYWKSQPSFPFVVEPEQLDLKDLVCRDHVYYLALAPLALGVPEDEYEDRLARFLAKYPEQKFAVGLNNLFHLSLVKGLSRHPGVSFFIDYALYCANLFAFIFFLKHVPRLLGQYFWVEGNKDDFLACKTAAGGVDIPLLKIDKPWSFPLFISRACFKKYSGENCENCPKQGKFTLRQMNRSFLLVIRNCISYLFAAKADSE
jgi:putative protease